MSAIGTAALVYTLHLTREALSLSRKAVRDADEHMKLQLRAYVGAMHSEVEFFEVGRSPMAYVNFTNHGLTTARNIRVSVNAAYFDRASGFIPVFASPNIPKDLETKTAFSDGRALPVLTPEMKEAVEREPGGPGYAIAIWGFALYDDVYGARHKLYFTRKHWGPGAEQYNLITLTEEAFVAAMTREPEIRAIIGDSEVVDPSKLPAGSIWRLNNS